MGDRVRQITHDPARGVAHCQVENSRLKIFAFDRTRVRNHALEKAGGIARARAAFAQRLFRFGNDDGGRRWVAVRRRRRRWRRPCPAQKQKREAPGSEDGNPRQERRRRRLRLASPPPLSLLCCRRAVVFITVRQVVPLVAADIGVTDHSRSLTSTNTVAAAAGCRCNNHNESTAEQKYS